MINNKEKKIEIDNSRMKYTNSVQDIALIEIKPNEDEINNFFELIYKTDNEDIEEIFGEKFVENNKNNIELIINGNTNDLINKYKLKKGENNIKIIIKNKITNLENMFYNCKSLKNIEE